MSEVEARTVLWYLVFVGFAVNYMIRINLNITIVEMIIIKSKPIHSDKHSHTISPSASPLSSDTFVAPSLGSPSLGAIESAALIDYATTVATTTTTTTTAVKGNESEGVSGDINHIEEIKIQPHLFGDIEEFPRHHEFNDQHDPHHHHNNDDRHHYFPHGGQNLISAMEQQLFMNATPISLYSDTSRFNWNEYQQGLVLGSFFWGHWITQIPGGILAKKYGTKLVFGLSNAIACWMGLLIPAASYWDYRALIWIRVMQGLILGLAWPAMHVLTAKWIPPNERSKFVSAYLGASGGTAFSYFLFGYVMHWSSWPWVFVISGILGTIWWLGWLIFVFDSPAEHPRISETERRYIENSLGDSVQWTTPDIGAPWKEIFLSRPVWMNVIAQWGGIWGLLTLLTEAPTYFRVLHNWDIRGTGIFSGLPHLLRMIFAYFFSIFADYLLAEEKMSRTNVRKLATSICCILNGTLVMALAYFGHNATAAIVFLTLATMFHGAVAAGPLASVVDIAPNFAGIILGIVGTICMLPGFISPHIVGILTLDNQTFDAWKNVFQICATMLIGGGVLYVLFADSTLQKWNDYSG